MSQLAGIAVVMGCLTVLFHFPWVLGPEPVRKWYLRFPRNKWLAGALTAVDLVWVGWLLYHTPLGWFDAYKTALYLLVPVSFALIVTFMAELLAPRALGGLLLLTLAPAMAAARWEQTPLRLLVILFAYALVIAAIVLVLCPYQFRRSVTALTRTNLLCRLVGGVGVAFGLLLIVVGVVVY
jgi:hypothetical protein